MKLYPTCGRLHPDGLAALARADDFEQVRGIAEYYAVIGYRFIEKKLDKSWTAIFITGVQGAI